MLHCRFLLMALVSLFFLSAGCSVQPLCCIAEGTSWETSDAVSPDSLQSASWHQIEHPVLKNHYGSESTLWLRVKIPDGSSAVHLRNVDQCFRAYCRGKLVYTAGSRTDMLSPFDWHIIPLPERLSGEYLYLEVYSALATIGVVNEAVWFGSTEDIISRILYEDIDKLVSGILFMLFGIASLLMVFSPVSRTAFASFGLFALTLGIYTVTQGRIKQLVFGHDYHLWGIVELVSLYSVPCGINLFVNQILHPGRKNPVRYLWMLTGVFALISISAAVVSPGFLMASLYFFQIFLLMNIFVGIAAVIAAVSRGNREAMVFGFGILVLTLFASCDILQNLYILKRGYYITHWGLLLFTLCLFSILIRRIIQTYREAGNNARKIEYNNIILNQAYQQMEDLQKEIVLTQKEVIFRLSEVSEARSRETGNHVRRVAEYCRLLAIGSGMPYDQVDVLKLAAPMHDIGKLSIPDAILNKPGKLTPEEFELIKSHTVHGYEMLNKSERQIFHAAAIVAWEHHEKFSGGGYPRGISGEEIHIFGRITAVADVFDSLASDRCYKKAWEMDRVLSLMKEERGKHFDPVLVDVLFGNLSGFMQIKDSFRDE